MVNTHYVGIIYLVGFLLSFLNLFFSCECWWKIDIVYLYWYYLLVVDIVNKVIY